MGFKIEQWKRGHWLPMAALALCLWLAYLKTLSPAFPANDSPETISAAWELGIQHPPGYPLHSLLANLAAHDLGLGSPAWRVNMLSAALACLAALLAACLAQDLSQGSLNAALAAGFSLGLWKTIWEQATEAKGGIYLLNLVLGLALLKLTLSVEKAVKQREESRAMRLWGLLAGLSLAGHYMSALLFIIPCKLYLLWRGKWRGLWTAAPWTLAGLSLYLYLPLRAVFRPFNNLGDPSTWKGFLWVVLRQGYTQSGLLGRWDIAWDQVQLWWQWSWTHGAYAVFPLGLFGLWKLKESKPAQALLLASCYAFFFVSVVLINRTLPDVRWLSDIFMIPGNAVIAVAAGIGLSQLSPKLGLALLLAAGLAWSQFQILDRSWDYAAYDFAADLEQGLPRGAVYAADGDYLYMPLLYRKVVQERRPDIEPTLAALWSMDWYNSELARRGVGAITHLSMLHPSMPDAQFAPSVLQPQGLAFEVERQALAPRTGLAKAWAQRGDRRSVLEPLTAQLLPWYCVALVNQGNALEALGKHQDAAASFAMALGEPGEKPDSHILYNLGSARAASGDKAGAKEAFERALEKEPGLQPAQEALQALMDLRGGAAAPEQGRSLADALKQADAWAAQGKAAQALPIYQKAVAAGIQNASIWRNIGVLSFQSGQVAQADAAFAKAISLAPKDPLLYKYRLMSLEKIGTKADLKKLIQEGVAQTGDAELKTLLDRLK
jgi:Tfp pilus assembly protein PilF